jgi:hypothetical protein
MENRFWLISMFRVKRKNKIGKDGTFEMISGEVELKMKQWMMDRREKRSFGILQRRKSKRVGDFVVSTMMK